MRATGLSAILRSTVVAVATNTLWQGLDGIIATTDFGGHHIIRALAVLYERNTTYSDLQQYIKKYIGVQYNAVIEKTTSGGSNIYGLPWTGPPRTSFSSFNQTVAVTALLSAIQLEDDDPSSKSHDNPSSSRTPTAKMTTPPLSSKKDTTGAIAGGVVGGLAILAVIIARKMLSPVDAGIGQSSTSLGAVEIDTTGMDIQVESTTPLGAAASPPNLLHTEGREDMPTEELLKLLNQRLLLGRWNYLVDELPPEYDEGRTTW
ncbi:hypothetical protein EDD85DRAFT_953322 [Armillaria nabsnona]|nr:hypothetical protein EDD85DRAFT_953322 [Armillaria nabsnona]